tara:strand:- start:33 stop:239 length:207 start_codon:yes stop_codon:yes gene_type:complete
MINLKYYRKINGLTQKDLAFILDTTQQNIQRWETGKVNLNVLTAIKLSKIFNVKVENLINSDHLLTTQ